MKTRWILLLLAGLGIATFVVLGLEREPGPVGRTAHPDDASVHAVCGRCHLFPAPTVLPRSAWRTQIEHMAFLVVAYEEWAVAEIGKGIDAADRGAVVADTDVEAWVRSLGTADELALPQSKKA